MGGSIGRRYCVRPRPSLPGPPEVGTRLAFHNAGTFLKRARSRQLGNRLALGPFWKTRATTSGTVEVQSRTLAIVQGTSVGGTFLVTNASLTVDGSTQLLLADYSLDADWPSAGRAT